MEIKPTILYIDDEAINLKLFNINFRNKYTVITVESAEKALEVLDHNHDIKAVVSDFRMPFMNGIEFIKIAIIKHPDIKYYVLTGCNVTQDIKDAVEDKLILNYFTKPLNKKAIDQEISYAITH